MEERISFNLFFVGLFSALLSVVLTATAFHNSFDTQIKSDLMRSAGILAESYDYFQDYTDLKDFTDHNFRITLIAPEGDVLFESDADAAVMENHADRPEIQEALESGSGQITRQSSTINKNVYYYAVRLDDGNVLRVSTEAKTIYSTFSSAFPLITCMLLALMLVSVLLAVLLTKKLVRPIKQLADNLTSLDLPADDKKIYKELVPFVKEIQAQRIKIEYQLHQLQEEKNKLSAILQNMSEGLIILDDRKNVLLLNESAKKYLNVTEAYENKNVLYLSRSKPFLDCLDSAAKGNSHSVVLPLEGRVFQVLVNPVVTEEHRGIICLILDITEKNQIEKMKQEFTANVSHELKTPLTSISGYAEMMETGMAKPEDIPDFAAKIHREAGRLLTLISDIIKLSELDENQKNWEAAPVDLLEVAEETSNLLSFSAIKHHVTVSVDGQPAIVNGSRHLLSELVYNLCDNAIRYNKENGHVWITVAPGSITVKDTGIGIPKEYQKRVFERFYRVDKSRSKETGGTGLGLAIVKHIAEQHHASIQLQSQEGVGTEIQILFPK